MPSYGTLHVITICFLFNNHLYYCLRVIDVGSEWRTFSNEKGGEDRSRVGGPENTLLGSSDLTTMIGRSECRLTRFVWLCSGGLFGPVGSYSWRDKVFRTPCCKRKQGCIKLPPPPGNGRTDSVICWGRFAPKILLCRTRTWRSVLHQRRHRYLQQQKDTEQLRQDSHQRI